MSHIPEYQLEQLFNDHFDECFPDVRFGALTYSPSDVLKSTDPIAYREEFLYWLNQEVEHGNLIEQNDEYYLPEA